MSVVKLYDIRWVSHTAGFSPIKTKFGPNARTELFFMGCKKAISGNPCKECFNPKLWKDIKGARELNPTNMAEHIEKFAPNKYISIVGGEPFDQPEGLTDLCEELKKRDFHIIVFTHYTLKDTFKRWKDYGKVHFAAVKRIEDPPDIIEGWTHDLFIRFLKNIDILVDGEYDKDKRIYDESLHDGFHDAVGSSNQIVWDLREWRDNNFSTAIYGQLAENILQLGLREKDNSLVFITKHRSYRVFPLFLKESKNSGEKHTRWFVSSFDLEISVHDDFWLYYYLLRFKTDEKSEQESRNDIKRDIRRYCTLQDIDKAVINHLCNNVDDRNFFLYNNLWLNKIARYYDNGHYEAELDEIRRELN